MEWTDLNESEVHKLRPSSIWDPLIYILVRWLIKCDVLVGLRVGFAQKSVC